MTTDPSALTTEGAYGGRALRASVSMPLDAFDGSALISARRSMAEPLSDRHDDAADGASFQDVFARATIPVRDGQLEVFAFHSGDRLAFDAASEHPGGPAGSFDAGQRVPPSSNALSWVTGTDAIRWRSDGDTKLEVRAWRTRFDAAFTWTSTTQLRSSYAQIGSAAEAKWTMGGAQITAGVDASKLEVGYDVGTGTDFSDPSLALSGSPLIIAAIGEARWKLGERWSFALGLRDPVIAPSGKGPEPRLSARFAPNQRLSFGVAYARQHQYVQSLRNEESLLDVLAGITLPVASGSSGNGETMPVARADQIATTVDTRLTSTLDLSAIAYTRHESDLALVAPISAAPFALSTFAIGSADSRGMSVLLERTGTRVSGDLAYSLSSTWRHAGTSTYAPDFSSTHTISLGVADRLWPATTLRAAASYNSGAPASVYGDPLEWTPYTPSSGSGDLSGSPQHVVGALNDARLPPYFRLDFGIRHEWGLSIFGIGARLAGNATITNVLGRGNALGLTQPYGGSLQSLLLPARSLELGFEWRH